MQQVTQTFEHNRTRLFRLAYSMLGSVSDAEDIVQDAFLKWMSVNHDQVQSDWAYLSTIVSRLCLDELRSAKRRRETYIGPWLPEPLIQTDEYSQNPQHFTEHSEILSMAMMVVLESLTPVQRAVYILHDLFGFDFTEISGLIGKDPANCRKIAQRARSYLDARKPGKVPNEQDQITVLKSFINAVDQGEVEQLKDLLTEEAILYSDGGGKVTAAHNPIYGNGNISRFLMGIAQKTTERKKLELRWINGNPGLLVWLDERLNSAWAFLMDENKIRNIYVVLNPDKLRSA